MSQDPYTILGIDPQADDATIRQRYLQLVREFPPEHAPEKFAAIRAAYEQVQSLESRVSYRLFAQGKNDSVEQLIEDVLCQMPRTRPQLRLWMQTVAPKPSS